MAEQLIQDEEIISLAMVKQEFPELSVLEAKTIVKFLKALDAKIERESQLFVDLDSEEPRLQKDRRIK